MFFLFIIKNKSMISMKIIADIDWMFIILKIRKEVFKCCYYLRIFSTALIEAGRATTIVLLRAKIKLVVWGAF